MQLSKIYSSLLAIGVVAALQGCSDSEGKAGREPIVPDYNAPAAGTYSGRVMDGYLQNAVVWIDKNNNRLQDAGEPETLSGAQGLFTFSKEALDAAGILRPNAYPIGVKAIAGQTVDEDTGAAISQSYYLWAPAVPYYEPRIVSPFSTLVKAERDMRAYSPRSPTQAYAAYTAPPEKQIAENWVSDHNAVRQKLGLTQNLLLDYINADNARLHMYARVLVRSMQSYIQSVGGSLDSLVTSYSPADFAPAIQAIYDDPSLTGTTRVTRLIEATRLDEASVNPIEDNDGLDTPSKVSRLAELSAERGQQREIDALSRVLVNQGRWVVATVDEAAGPDATQDTYRALALDNVPPVNLAFLNNNDPRLVYRKKIYLNPNTLALPSSSLADTLYTMEGEAPYASEQTLTQVQEYSYYTSARLRSMTVSGTLPTWRRELLVSYPVFLEAGFPSIWSFERKNPAVGLTTSTQIQIRDEDAEGVVVRTVEIDGSGNSEPDGVVDEVWTQVWETSNDASCTFPQQDLPTDLWASHAQLPDKPCARVREEVYPAVDLLLNSVRPDLATTSTNTTTGFTNYGYGESKMLVARDLLDVLTGTVIRQDRINYATRGPELSLSTPAFSGLIDAAYTFDSRNKRPNEVRVAVNDQPPEATLTELTDYCVTSSYATNGDLEREIIFRNCASLSTRQPVMVIEYEHKFLSELLVRQ